MRERKEKASGNNTDKILQKSIKLQAQESIKRFYGKKIGHSILKRKARYQQTWLLVCGMTGSGKSSLLNGSEVNFQLSHPPQKDSFITDNCCNISWHFSKESVWIDTPGSMMEESGEKQWRFFAESIRDLRPARPIDGLVLIIDINKIANSDDQGIKSTGSLLQKRIYELTDIWELEFPVYLIFNQSDQLPGFSEYFAEQLQNDNGTILGATFSEKNFTGKELALFNEKYNVLCNILAAFRLDKLQKEKNNSKKIRICSFVIHFEGMKIKIERLISEIFKRSWYGGSPFLRGFYFTCYNDHNIFEKAETENCIQIENTILNHPLNPHSFREGSQDETWKRDPKSKVIKASFVSSLFNEIIVNDHGLVKPTRKKEKRDALCKLLIFGILVLAGALIINLYIKNENLMEKFIDNTCITVKSLKYNNCSFEENYTEIDNLRDTIEKIRKYSKKYPIFIGFGFYKVNEILSELEKEYFQRASRFIVIPASKYLEYKILKLSSSGIMSGKEYRSLYSSLKAYLIISGDAHVNSNTIDTSVFSCVLLNASEKAVSATMNISDIPEPLDRILQRNIEFYLNNFGTDEFRKISADKNIITRARNCLKKIPGPETLYESAMSDIVKDVPKISLESIIGKKDDEKLLQSDNEISFIYTQEGWETYVRDALMKTADNPFKNDWVIGNSENAFNNSVPDDKKLYEKLVDEYFKDLKEKWLTFISSIRIENPRNINECLVMLNKLQSANSELSTLFETVSKLAIIKDEEQDNENLKSGIGAVLSKKCKAISKIIKNINNKNRFQNTNKIFFDRNAEFFKYLNTFGNSSESQNYALYKKKLSALSDELVTVEGQPDKFPETFNGSNNDQLTEGYKWIKNAPFSIPDELQSAVLKSLIQPFEFTGNLVSESIEKALNDIWYNEVYKLFASEIRGKYPFEETEEDASFQEIIDFFRPKTGSFWGFKERFLSNYSGDENDKVIENPNSVIKIRLNPELYSSMEISKRISEIFFRPDGKQKIFDIRIQPNFSDKFKANLEIAGQKQNLISGTVVNINWPNESKTVTLSLENQNGILQNITFNGEWGLLKLLNSAKLSKLNSSTFTTRWLFNVQNIYTINLDASVHVSEQENPFTETAFKNFSCPQKIVNDHFDQYK